MTLMPLAYISLGSNMGDRAATLRAAAQKLSQHGTVVAASALYETAPKDYVDQPAFLNAVVGLETQLTAHELMRALLQIERSLGRERSADAPAKGPRRIDLDLLLYRNDCGDLICQGLREEKAGLQVPHPRMHKRLFVLAPLAEIAPDVVHPLLQLSARELRDGVASGEAEDSVRELAGGSEWALGRG